MLPLALVVLLIGGVAFAATQKADARPLPGPGNGTLPAPTPPGERPVVEPTVEPGYVDPYEVEPDVPGPVPEPEPEPEPDIPYGEGWVWELFLNEDGELYSEDGQWWDPMEVEIGICEGDTIILHTPPLEDAAAYIPVVFPAVPWIEMVVDSWEWGLFVWHVHDPIQSGGMGQPAFAQVAIDIWDHDAEDYVRYGFNTEAIPEEDCVPMEYDDEEDAA